MDLADLAIFRAVLSEGGVTAAARRLNRVQSNVTTRIRQLEDSLGVSLFERDGRGLRPTPAATVLAGYAEQLLALAEEAKQAVAGDTPRGRLRLGSMESTAAIHLPGLLADFHQQYPEVELELRTGPSAQLEAAVRAGELDAALVCDPGSEAGLQWQSFSHETLLLISPPGMGALPAASGLTLLTFDHGCAYRGRLLQWLAAQKAQPGRVVALGSYHAMISCVASGMGVAIVPQALLAMMPTAAAVRCHLLPEPVAAAETVLIRRSGRQLPALNALQQLIAARAEV